MEVALYVLLAEFPQQFQKFFDQLSRSRSWDTLTGHIFCLILWYGFLLTLASEIVEITDTLGAIRMLRIGGEVAL